MKELGTTPEGGKIVELTHSEANILGLLQEAIDGMGWDWEEYLHNRGIQDKMMDDAFQAIKQFVIAKFAINDMRIAVDRLDGILTALEHGE